MLDAGRPVSVEGIVGHAEKAVARPGGNAPSAMFDEVELDAAVGPEVP